MRKKLGALLSEQPMYKCGALLSEQPMYKCGALLSEQPMYKLLSSIRSRNAMSGVFKIDSTVNVINYISTRNTLRCVLRW
jgi:hypothetical protein